MTTNIFRSRTAAGAEAHQYDGTPGCPSVIAQALGRLDMVLQFPNAAVFTGPVRFRSASGDYYDIGKRGNAILSEDWIGLPPIRALG